MKYIILSIFACCLSKRIDMSCKNPYEPENYSINSYL